MKLIDYGRFIQRQGMSLSRDDYDGTYFSKACYDADGVSEQVYMTMKDAGNPIIYFGRPPSIYDEEVFYRVLTGWRGEDISARDVYYLTAVANITGNDMSLLPDLLPMDLLGPLLSKGFRNMRGSLEDVIANLFYKDYTPIRDDVRIVPLPNGLFRYYIEQDDSSFIMPWTDLITSEDLRTATRVPPAYLEKAGDPIHINGTPLLQVVGGIYADEDRTIVLL